MRKLEGEVWRRRSDSATWQEGCQGGRVSGEIQMDLGGFGWGAVGLEGDPAAVMGPRGHPRSSGEQTLFQRWPGYERADGVEERSLLSGSWSPNAV